VQRFRIFSLLAVGTLALLVMGTTSGAGGLPSQAPATADDHAYSHPDGLDLDARGRGRPGAAAITYDVDAHASWEPGQWTGVVSDKDQADATSGAQFHAIYMYPSGSTSRFGQFASMFQADARDAANRLFNQYGRSTRWDNQTNGNLDITVLKSSSNAKRLSSGNQFSLVRNELINRGFTNSNKKYVVWLDAGSTACGQGELYQDTRRTSANYNEGRTTAIVYRPYPNDATTGGFCRGRTAMHEIGHNMGALQKVAPHAFDGAHCNDSAEDVMCYTSATSYDSGPTGVFDYKNDDYWDPPSPAATLPWWTVNLSKYICTASC
jgi:hypothetical protein